MVVNSLRGYWHRISARIRDYLDASDEYECRAFNRSALPMSSALPNGYQKRKTVQGQVYFLHSSGVKTWYDPRVPRELRNNSLSLDTLIGKLSPMWEVRQTPTGKCYYVNHRKKTTQFTDPRLVKYRDYLMSILATTRIPNERNAPMNCNAAAAAVDIDDRQDSIAVRTDQLLRHTAATSTAINSNPTTNNSNNNPNQTNMTKSKHKDALPHYNNTGTSSNRGQACEMQAPPSPHSTNSLNRTPNVHISPTRTPCLKSPVNIDYKNPRSESHRIPYSTYKGKDLFSKISILREELQKSIIATGLCKIEVSRKNIFEQSYRSIRKMRPKDLRKRLVVKFRGEEGIDYGGVAREWLYLLSKEMLNPNYGIFQYTGEDIYNLQISPDSGIAHEEHLSYFNFCGRVMGLAVFHGHYIEGRFALPFYKMLLNQKITLSDIEHVDSALYHGLRWMLENDITDVIDIPFSVVHNAYGEVKDHELKEGGKLIAVTEKNKQEYVDLYVNYRYTRGIEEQFRALQRGFHELIPPDLLSMFDEQELELLVCGLSKIDIEDWRSHTRLKHCTADSPIVKWFWDVVRSYNEERRARLLQFVTGSSRVPLHGFKALQGGNNGTRPFTIHSLPSACTDNLPKAHTCFNRIDIPPYESYDKLYDKLTQAIEETIGFAVE